MPIRTDLSPTFRPTTPSTPAAPDVPAASVDQLIGKALDGTITKPEAQQLSKLLDTPALKDAFTAQQRADLKQFAEGRGLPPRDPSELHSDFKLVKDAKELPGRFAADLVLAHESLLEHAALLRADKASRLFAFAVPYAQQLTQMAQSPQELMQLAAQMLLQAEKAGFKSLERQPDGRDGLRVLKDLLKAGSAEEIARLANGLRFDAPIWPKDPIRQSEQHHPADQEHLQLAKAGEAGMRPMPQIMQAPVPIQRRVEDTDPSPQDHHDDHGTHKKLSPMLLWNALHTLRDAGEDGQESAAQREAMTQLAVAAGLILVFMAIVVGVLVFI